MIIASGGLRAIAPPYGGILSGLTPQGTVVWTIDTTDVIWGSAAMTSDLAFVNVNSSIQALDPLKGNVLWSYPTVGTFVGSPAIGPSGVFTADLAGVIYAFTTGAPSSSPTAIASRKALMQLPRDGSRAFIHILPRTCTPGQYSVNGLWPEST